MNPFRKTTLALLAAASLAACSSMPDNNAMLDRARSDYRDAQASTATQTLAPVELKQAGDALALADAAFARRDDTERVNQLAYLARQRTALAREAANRKTAEAAVATAAAERDKMRLADRTREADAATADASQAMRDARSSQRQSEASQRDAQSAQRDAQSAQRDAQSAQQQAAASQMQAGDAERRNQMLETQLRELNAKKTERGMVITIGDVLFDTGHAELKSGSAQSIQRLGTFLKAYPQRRASIEGYTDSTGSDSGNMALSGRRADAVRAALLAQGVDNAQIASQGFGSSNPVAGNDNAGGRQMNRRVEIVLSNERGVIGKR
jgi:outer membrane protein OmpA-like peptidoglycan-associated protein